LELLGCVGKVCPTVWEKSVRWSVLCPSLAVAADLLREEGLTVSPHQLQQFLGRFAGWAPAARAALATAPAESLAGQQVELCVDGGRYRKRVAKPGRLPPGAKRRGYTTDWHEPRLFTLAVRSPDGTGPRRVLVDGSTGSLADFLALLRAYAARLHLAQAAQVTLLGDGAPWIWQHVPALLRELGLPVARLREVIDWYHANENLCALVDQLYFLLSSAREQCLTTAQDRLYHGDLAGLEPHLLATARGRRERALVRRKLASYFHANAGRFHYPTPRDHAIGSGQVESAIRRVLNLRIKAPGSFWHRAQAEAVLFLRAQLLYGRWPTLLANHFTAQRIGWSPLAAVATPLAA